MILSPATLNAQLALMGQNVTWARASFCPCRDPQTGAARIGCPICAGRGVFWASPAPSRIGVAGMKVQREWERFGAFESGDVVVSLPSDTPAYAAGENDRILFVNSSEPFDVVLVRGAPNETPIWTAVGFDRCFWLSPDGAVIIEGGLPTQNPDRSFTWADGVAAPPEGTQYTLRGRKRPEYFLFQSFPDDRAHFGGLALPKRATLRKFDLFGR